MIRVFLLSSITIFNTLSALRHIAIIAHQPIFHLNYFIVELEISEQGTTRQVIGLRALPSLKNDLVQEAKSLGITLSEHCENIISTRVKIQSDIDILRLSLDEKEKEIQRLRSEAKTSALATPPILKDERLLFLFEKLKDKKDVVTNSFGKNFEIIYETPEDIVKALIYSTNLNDL